MDLRQLKYFVAVAERGSFRAAADALHIAQSALSRHVQLLEHELGGALFERGTHGVVVSESGKILLDRARFVLEQMRNIRAEVVAQNRELAGSVKLGAPPSLGDVLFVPIASHFTREHPRVHLTLIEGLTEDVVNKLVMGALDVAIVTAPCLNDHLEFIPYLNEKVYLIGPPGDARLRRKSIPLEEVMSLRIVSSVEFLRRQYMQAPHGKSLRNLSEIVVQVDSSRPLKQMVAAGLGYAIVPYSAIHEEVPKRKLSAVELPEISGERLIALPKGRPMTRSIRELVTTLQGETAKLVAAGKMRVVARP